jgi:hypothetical protein
MTKYQDHIHTLCRKYKIKIEHTRNDYSVDMLNKVIWIGKDIRTIKTYFGALHEIGHILNEHSHIHVNLNKVLWNQTRSKSNIFVSKYRMQTEVDAWKRAFELANWKNNIADKLTVNCLFTYIYGYNHSHKKPFKDIDNDFMAYVLDMHKNDDAMMRGIKDILFT